MVRFLSVWFGNEHLYEPVPNQHGKSRTTMKGEGSEQKWMAERESREMQEGDVHEKEAKQERDSEAKKSEVERDEMKELSESN